MKFPRAQFGLEFGRRDEMVSLGQAFEAMTLFLQEYWERGGRESEDLANLLGNLVPTDDGGPMDPAAWHDFLGAVDRARATDAYHQLGELS